MLNSFDVNVSLEDVVDFGEDGQASKFPYKFAMHKLEAKPTTLQINLLVNCQAIRQNVDMALLRLAHQVRDSFSLEPLYTFQPLTFLGSYPSP